MNIKYAILGFLSWRSMTGYDLKKLFTDTDFIYWSGNNNQIYRTLVQLRKEEMVTNEVHFQDKYPARKVYTITEAGLSELRKWVTSSPDPPQLRNTFLIQLAWADQLDQDELTSLVDKYEEEIHMHMLMCEEKERRKIDHPSRTPRENYLWKKIHENIIASFQQELRWVRDLKQGLADGQDE